ncbi:unnamed protein product [Closterium sp. NIES-65]|nr:unnamed protein product [Closterium sp. NIES-65]
MDGGRRAPAGRGGELSALEDDLLFSVLRRLDCRSDKLAAALVCKRWLAVIRGAYTHCTILNVRDEHVVAIAKRFGPSLQRLNLASNKRIGQAALEAIGAHCTQLQALWLTNGTFDDAALMPIASCHQLKVLGLGNCRSITDMGVCCIAAGCKAVQEVSLRWCVGITDRGVDVLLSNCHAIHTLDLSYTKASHALSQSPPPSLPASDIPSLPLCPLLRSLPFSLQFSPISSPLPTLTTPSTGGQVTEAAMRVVQRHPSLTHLNLSSCQSLTDPAIATLRHGCTALQSLDVSGCEQVTDVGLMALTAGAIPLTALTAAFCPQASARDSKVSDNLLAVLPRFPALRRLKLDLAPITDAGLSDLAGASSPPAPAPAPAAAAAPPSETSMPEAGGAAAAAAVEEGVLANEQRAAAGGAHAAAEGAKDSAAAGHGHATAVGAAHGLSAAGQAAPQVGVGMGVGRWAALGCWQLEEVSVRRCEAVGDEGLTALAAACPNLLSLDITCCSSVTDASLLALSAHCRRLACVRMEACRGVSDAGLVGLFQHCTALSTLDLTDCGISDTTVQGMRHCPLLQSLKLGFDMDITDAGLISLAASCSSLTELDLYRCEGVSCAGIAAVAQACTGLSTLNLSYCHRVRDAALIAIARHCPRLRNLEVRDAPLLTSAGLLAIAGLLPPAPAPQATSDVQGGVQQEAGGAGGRVWGCRELQEVDVKQCTGVDDAGFIALAHGCPDLRQANLSYTSISDAGLGAMAGMACMTKFNLVHCSRLSMPGLEAALTRCVGLKKVKLLQAWRPLLSPQLLADLEESGCRFRWMDKPPLEALRS